MALDDFETIVDRIASLPEEAKDTLVRSITEIEAYYTAEDDDALRSNSSL